MASAIRICRTCTWANTRDGQLFVKKWTAITANAEHPIAAKLKALYDSDKDKLHAYAKILYAQARLIGGMSIENPAELSSLVCDLMV